MVRHWRGFLTLLALSTFGTIWVSKIYRELTSQPAPESVIEYTLAKFEESEAAGSLSRVSCAERICNGQIRRAEEQTFNCYASIKKISALRAELHAIVFIFYIDGRRKYFQYDAQRDETSEVSVFQFRRAFQGRIHHFDGST